MKNLLCFFIFCTLPFLLTGQTNLTMEQTQRVLDSVFEVVQEKPESGNISYERELPWEQIPYLYRTDEFQSIGTAFAVGDNLFLSAAHVFNLEYASLSHNFFLRNTSGQVFSVQEIIKYDSHRDYVLFTAQGIDNETWLEFEPSDRMNESVLAVGNAYGEGIIFRDGLLTSRTPERDRGEWKWLRYSAAASPGNSGGPLINTQGRVMGIVTAKSDNENLNYALPIEEVGTLVPERGHLDIDINYMLPHFSGRERKKEDYRFNLPQAYSLLQKELSSVLEAAYTDILNRLIKNAELFPRDLEGSQRVLTETYASLFPLYITEKDDSSWQLIQPEEYSTSNYSSGGYLKYGDMGGDTFWQLELSEQDNITDYLNNPTHLMDTFLAGKKTIRNMGSEEIRITSLGAPSTEEWFSDRWGRHWQACTWELPFADYQALLFTLPTPSGAVGMMTLVSTSSLFPFYLDFKEMSNFIYVSFSASFVQWSIYLNQDYLPTLFRELDFHYTVGESFSLDSDFFSLSYDNKLMDISHESQMYLVPTFMQKEGNTIWDISRLYLYEDFQGDNYFGIDRIFQPFDKHDDEAMTDWINLVEKKYPHNEKLILSKGDSYIYDRIAISKDKEEDEKSNYLWALQLGREGEVDSRNMASYLSLLRNGFNLKEREYRAMIHGTDIIYQSPVLTKIEGKTIFQAVDSGNKELIQSFLKENTDLNALNNKGQSPIMAAIIQGNREMTEEFLSRGANLETKDHEGNTPLILACLQEWDDIALAIIKQSVSLDPRNEQNRSALYYALAGGLSLSVNEMLDRGAPTSESEESGYTMFMAALENSTPEICQRLMDQGIFQGGISNNGWTPAMIALRNDKPAIAGELIRKKENINQVNSEGWSVLLMAVRYSTLENVRDLIDAKADTSTTLPSGVGLLMLSYNNEENKDITDYLLDLNLDCNHTKDNGWTDLMYALRYGTQEQAWKTFEKTAIRTGKTDGGWNPLMLAIRYEKAELVGELINEGDDVNCRTEEGTTPLSLAAEFSTPFVVENLVERGADLFSVNEFNKTALMIAIREGNLQSANYLIDRGSPLDTLSTEGWNSLRYAFRYGTNNMVRKLMTKGVRINNGVTNKKWNDLHFAVRYSTQEIALIIMDSMDEIDAQTSDGWTALHLAVTDNNPLIDNLIEQGAIIDKKNNEGNTPLHLALMNDMHYALRILLEMGADPDKSNNEGVTARELSLKKSKVIQALFD